MSEHIVISAILSIFGDNGPVPEVVLLNEHDGIRIYKRDGTRDVHDPLDFGSLLQIAMKSISLLMGENSYQAGESIDELRYFGILPYPDLKMDGLTYFFLIPDKEARGSARATTITLLVRERNKNFFFDYWNELRVMISEHALNVHGPQSTSLDHYAEAMLQLMRRVNEFEADISFVSGKRNLKILFAGLDNSGKTSMILGLEKKYSKLVSVQPTKGVTRSTATIMGLTISVWDLAGQSSYREQYLKDAELYLFDCDLVFYLVDATDVGRFEESVEYLGKILAALREFEERIPVIVCLHKVDPDAPPSIKDNVARARQAIETTAGGFSVSFFETSIFEPFSLTGAFSYGLAALSPNRDIFRLQLETLAKHASAKAVYLLNEKGLIVSDFVEDKTHANSLEIVAPQFLTIFSTMNQYTNGKATEATYTIDNGKVTFHALDCGGFFLYVILFNAKASVAPHLGGFKNNIISLIETYF